MNPRLNRYIKSKQTNEKTELKVTSVNLEARQLEFVRRKDLNLSMLIRDVIDRLIQDEDSDLL